MARHTTTGRSCWCEPRLEEYPTGFAVMHDDVLWDGQWLNEAQENGDVIVRPAEQEEMP